MSPNEMNYYRERAAIERQRAAESTNPHVIDIHNKLASLYERLVDDRSQPRHGMRLVGDVPAQPGRE